LTRNKREQMITETRAKLIAAARQAFATQGYNDASMDEFTAEVGLTRGALYHHFGGKKGLFQAVISQIDEEMSARLLTITGNAEDTWTGFIDECVAYIEMALEPEIQRIVLLDGPAVLGDPSQWSDQSACLHTTMTSLKQLIEEGTIHNIDPEATARLVNGATLNASLWIANSDNPHEASKHAIDAFLVMMNGLLIQSAVTA